MAPPHSKSQLTDCQPVALGVTENWLMTSNEQLAMDPTGLKMLKTISPLSHRLYSEMDLISAGKAKEKLVSTTVETPTVTSS